MGWDTFLEIQDVLPGWRRFSRPWAGRMSNPMRTTWRGTRRGWLAAAALAAVCGNVMAVTFRYDTYREVTAPEDATFRLGPFYSTIRFSQSVGYRYVTTSGSGAAYLFGNNLGTIRKDGSDFPLVSSLSLGNYYIINKTSDFDFSFKISYHHFPMETEEDYWGFDLIDQGLTVSLGNFSATMRKDGWTAGYSADSYSMYSSEKGYGMSANISSEFELTRFVKGKLYDRPSVKTEYIDARGYSDTYSGRKYQYFNNIAGFDLDWQMTADQSLGSTISRSDTIPFSSSSFTNQRSVVYQASGIYERKLSEDLLAGLKATLTLREYPNSNRGDQIQHSYEIFAKWQATPDSTIELGGGVSYAKLSGAGAYETNGTLKTIIGRATLTTELSKKLWHSLGYRRELQAGFSAGLETIDEYRYSIYYTSANEWNIGISTGWRATQPELSTLTAYTDWTTQFSSSYPITDDLTLHLTGAYNQRRNDETGTNTTTDLTLYNDYNTLSANLGLTYVLSKRTTLAAYAQYTGRTSDAASLEYERYTTGVTLTYTYTF